MAETNINAYIQELVIAEKELDLAKARVEGLKGYIKANDEQVVEAPKVTKQVKVAKKVSRPVKIEVKTSKKDNK